MCSRTRGNNSWTYLLTQRCISHVAFESLSSALAMLLHFLLCVVLKVNNDIFDKIPDYRDHYLGSSLEPLPSPLLPPYPSPLLPAFLHPRCLYRICYLLFLGRLGPSCLNALIQGAFQNWFYFWSWRRRKGVGRWGWDFYPLWHQWKSWQCPFYLTKEVKKRQGERGMIDINRSGRLPGGGHGTPLQYSCLDNPTDRRAWGATIHRVVKE